MIQSFKFMKLRSLKRAVVLVIAQGAYAGKSPFAPGTAGTAVGVLLYLLLRGLPLAWYLVVCVFVTGIGVWAAGEAEKLLGKKDAPSIVIDEIAGYLISMIMAPSGWGYVIAAFFLFRIFDIVKPFPLHRIQDLHGGLGVMLDDVGAGIYTSITLQLTAALFRH